MNLEYLLTTGFIFITVFALIPFNKKIKKHLFNRLNNKQKLVTGIFIPLILFLITITIAEDAGYVPMVGRGERGVVGAFNWDKTWFIWMSFLFFVGVFEFILFDD